MTERLRHGDNAAMREFYALYGGQLAAICARYVGDADDVKDVLQESMIHLLTHIDRFEYRGEGSLRSWAVRIVVNESIDHLKATRRLEVARLDGDLERIDGRLAQGDGSEVRLGDDLADDAGDDEEPTVSGVPPDVLHRLVSQLPVGYRTVLNLYVFEGRSHREIAQMLGIRERSSSSQFSRAKHLLAKMIRQYLNTQRERQ